MYRTKVDDANPHLERDVGTEGTILVTTASIAKRHKGTIRALAHENDRVEDTGDSSTSNDRRPNNAVGCCQVVEQLRWRMGVIGDDRDVEDTSCALISLQEGQTALSDPLCLPSPVLSIETRTLLHDTRKPSLKSEQLLLVR